MRVDGSWPHGRAARARVLLVSLCVAAVAVAGCTSDDGDDAAWHGRDLAATDPPWREVSVASGTEYEIDFERTQGERLEWDWFVEDRKEIVFGVHSHRSGATLTLMRLEEVEHTGGIDADRDGTYSLTWMAGDGGLTVWFRTAQDFTVPEQ